MWCLMRLWISLLRAWPPPYPGLEWLWIGEYWKWLWLILSTCNLMFIVWWQMWRCRSYMSMKCKSYYMSLYTFFYCNFLNGNLLFALDTPLQLYTNCTKWSMKKNDCYSISVTCIIPLQYKGSSVSCKQGSEFERLIFRLLVRHQTPPK